jgi:hypothetical protein
MKLSADEVISYLVKQQKDREYIQKFELGIIAILSTIVLITRYIDESVVFEGTFLLLGLYLLYATLSVLNPISVQLANQFVIQTNILRRLDADQNTEIP